jgi:hypothetical protein
MPKRNIKEIINEAKAKVLEKKQMKKVETITTLDYQMLEYYFLHTLEEIEINLESV